MNRGNRDEGAERDGEHGEQEDDGFLENPAELNAKCTKPATFLPKIGANIAVEAVALPEDMRVQGAKLLESSQSCLLTTRISG